jgi:hypothetical protein
LVNFTIFTLGKFLPVEKDLLQKVLQNYPSSTAQDAEKLRAMKAAYPYSQVLHVLAARVSKEHAFDSQQNELQMAAVYSADRGVLKHMMSNESGQPMSPINEVSVPASNIRVTQLVQHKETVIKEQGDVPSALESQDPFNGDDLAEQVIKDVKALYKTRHDFEKMFVDNPVRHLAASVRPGDETIRSKRERIIEMSKALNAQPMKEGDQAPVGKRRRLERKDIIDEIANTKHEIEPADPKQKEQLDIIDNFIQTQPSISNSKEKPLQINDGDLSSIKTGEFGDNIVSETLVELLLKQGKKEKAVEVLKKLIWKFPQKKTYFAAQIEELKK